MKIPALIGWGTIAACSVAVVVLLPDRTGSILTSVPFTDALRGSFVLPAVGILAVLTASGGLSEKDMLRVAAVSVTSNLTMIAVCAAIAAMFDVDANVEYITDCGIGLAGGIGAILAHVVLGPRGTSQLFLCSCMLSCAICILVLRMQVGETYDPIRQVNPVLFAAATSSILLAVVLRFHRRRSRWPPRPAPEDASRPTH